MLQCSKLFSPQPSDFTSCKEAPGCSSKRCQSEIMEHGWTHLGQMIVISFPLHTSSSSHTKASARHPSQSAAQRQRSPWLSRRQKAGARQSAQLADMGQAACLNTGSNQAYTSQHQGWLLTEGFCWFLLGFEGLDFWCSFLTWVYTIHPMGGRRVVGHCEVFSLLLIQSHSSLFHRPSSH